MMTEMIHGAWRRVEGAVQQGWGRLTSNGASYLEGGKKRLDGKMEANSALKGTTEKRELAKHLDRNA